MSSGQAAYYLGLAREDYYVQGGEPPGRWHGEGCQSLGLKDAVSPEELYNLFAGFTPDGSAPLVQLQRHNDRARHRPGWDLTFSAPKSVSVLWSQSEPELRAAVQDAHWQAVRVALDYLQDAAAVSPRSKAGKVQERASMVVAAFEHSTSRALDPQLHTHALVLNIAVRGDGSTGTLSPLAIFKSKMAAGAIYRLHLSGLLLRDLGLKSHRVNSWFELDGVPRELIAEFSKRREAIERDLQAKGRDGAKASAVSAIETRDAKKSVSRSSLFAEWRATGHRHGWTQDQVSSLLLGAAQNPRPDLTCQEAARRTLHELMSSQAHFTERDFVRYLAEQAQSQNVLATELLSNGRIFLNSSPEVLRLGRAGGVERFTTPAMVALETSLFSHVQALTQRTGLASSQDSTVRAIAASGGLNEEQTKAVWHVTAGSNGFAQVCGLAGTGKTRLLASAAAVWRGEGREVIGVALSGRASNELKTGAGIPALTIAKFLSDARKGAEVLQRGSVLIVDEAGMVATPDLDAISSLCDEHLAKLVVVGDHRQLQPIGPGAPFKGLGLLFGQIELQEIRRQNDAWARKAVKDVAEGKSREALEEFASRGFVKVHETKDLAMEALIRDWMESDAPVTEKTILAASRADTARLNALAQGARASAGQLEEELATISGTAFHVGDRVMFTRRYATLGVVNGDKGVLVSQDKDRGSATVRLDTSERVSFEVDAMAHLALAYATTTHKAQGASVARTFALVGGPMQDRELSYVQASRAKECTAFYVTRADAGDDMARLATEMRRSRQKDLAMSIEPSFAVEQEMEWDSRR